MRSVRFRVRDDLARVVARGSHLRAHRRQRRRDSGGRRTGCACSICASAARTRSYGPIALANSEAVDMVALPDGDIVVLLARGAPSAGADRSAEPRPCGAGAGRRKPGVRQQRGGGARRRAAVQRPRPRASSGARRPRRDGRGRSAAAKRERRRGACGGRRHGPDRACSAARRQPADRRPPQPPDPPRRPDRTDQHGRRDRRAGRRRRRRPGHRGAAHGARLSCRVPRRLVPDRGRTQLRPRAPSGRRRADHHRHGRRALEAAAMPQRARSGDVVALPGGRALRRDRGAPGRRVPDRRVYTRRHLRSSVPEA